MEPYDTAGTGNDGAPFTGEMSQLLQEHIMLSESVYTRLPMGIEVYDADGILRSMNECALRIYGVEDRASVLNVVNLFDSPYCDEALKAKIQSGEDVSLEFEYDFDRIKNDAYFSTRNRNTMIYEARLVPIRSKTGLIVGHLLITNDVTATKEAEFRTEESKKNLEMAMEAASMSSWVYDVRKQVFSTLYGETVVRDAMTMEELQDMLHPQDRSRLRELFSRLISGEVRQGQITVRVFDKEEGRYRHYESRMRLSTEHLGKLLIVGTQLDVTEKLRMAKRTRDLLVKRELAMKVSNIVHWDFDVRTGTFEAYNDPVNDYAAERPVTVERYLEVVHPEDRSCVNDAVQSMLSGKEADIDFTCRIRTKYDDSWQYCTVTGVPFEHDENGEVIRFTGFRQNISRLHRLNEELEERNYKMELTFRTVGMSYWDFDADSRLFRAFNDPVNDFRSEKPITPEDYLAAAHPDDAERIRENIGCMLEGTSREFSFQYRSRTGWNEEWQTMIVTGIPLERDKSGRVRRYTGIAVNNTKWEKMAQELKEMKDRAELSDRLKSAFLANMSHEIRTPLNAIIGFSGLLVNCDDPDEKAEYWSIIESNNELLLRLINDILDLSKIESGILERRREKFNLAQVCAELYAMIRLKVSGRDVELRMDDFLPDCWVVLDGNRLRQVWMNFLTNAVKCTESGYIKMGYSAERDGIRIYVEDTGFGIPEELHGRVFGRFQKLNEFVQGTGLGLAISKAIVEAAGGEVGFSSKPGSGSVFWAWIPCEVHMEECPAAPPAVSADDRPAGRRAGGKKMRILVAEDNDSNYSLVRHILRDYDLTRAENGAEAVREVREGKFDFVLMDMKMPVMGGLEATRKIREFDSAIPIVALTANAFDSDRAEAMEAGCSAFLTKPLKRDLLLGLLSEKR